MRARAPVIVGVAQLVDRQEDARKAFTPLSAIHRVATGALGDAGLAPGTATSIDTVALVNVVSWGAQNAPNLVAESLGCSPRREYEHALGGDAGLNLAARVARDIEEGQADFALIAGSHHFRTEKLAARQGVELDWPRGGAGAPELIGDGRYGTSDHEHRHGMAFPPEIYPLFEIALRHHKGLSIEEHRREMGRLFSRLSEVAAKNPYAWFPEPHGADALTNPTPDNRMIAYPYTKRLNAIIDTNQTAGLIMMSAERARRMQIPESQWVHWWAHEAAEERAWYASERPVFTDCPALRSVVQRVLGRAEVDLDDLSFLDIYSCFPSAVAMACAVTGISEEDPRGLSVTGGLPYAGGPGNSYTLHSLASMVDRLRSESGSIGLVTGNAWYLTKHSAVLLSNREPDTLSETVEETSLPAPEPAVTEFEPRGVAQVETYTVLHSRDGAPHRGIVLGRLRESGKRFIANMPEDPDVLDHLESHDCVGLMGTVVHSDGVGLFTPS